MLYVILLALIIVFAVLAIKRAKQVKEKQAEIDKKNAELHSVQSNLQETASILQQIQEKYKDVIDIDSAVDERKTIMVELDEKISSLRIALKIEKEQYRIFQKELAFLEENLEEISFGFYKPHYDYTTSEEFKQKLEEIRNRQKNLIKEDTATHCPASWTVGGSKKEGEKMIRQYSKLMLRAFNGECDAAMARVSWNNIGNMEARIEKTYETINKLASAQQVTITKEYLDLKLAELRLEHELEEKLYQEKEEQKRIKEQMREEEKALREAEKAQKDAEAEEQRYQKALEKAMENVQSATGAELDKLNQIIKEMEAKLAQAHEQKVRAMSMAQQTKCGHVYIISNIGSFGEDVFKIGMTRRLEPMDRIKELGDASVPFDFDVHALIYCDNAPELENTLHKVFNDRRLNLVNYKREFFNVTIDEIEGVVQDLNLNFQMTKLAEAKEYRETQSLRESTKEKDIEAMIEDVQNMASASMN